MTDITDLLTSFITVSDTAPLAPDEGSLWFDSVLRKTICILQ